MLRGGDMDKPKCEDCRWWGKDARPVAKDWKKCMNPNAQCFDMWLEGKNNLCKGFFEPKEEP